MTHEEMPNSANACTYDLPISVVAEYSIPPLSSGLGGTKITEPKMHAATRMADQNYRTREYHDFVIAMAELHRPIVKINTIMPCPTCDPRWYVRASFDAHACQFWAKAVKFGLVKDNELEPPIPTVTTTFAANNTDKPKVVEHKEPYIQYRSIGD